MTRFERTILFAYCLNVTDVILTVHLTTQLGMIELNPIMAGLLDQSPALFALVKLGAMAAICELFRRRHKEHKEATAFALGVVIGMLLLICAWQINLVFWATSNGSDLLVR